MFFKMYQVFNHCFFVSVIGKPFVCTTSHRTAKVSQGSTSIKLTYLK